MSCATQCLGIQLVHPEDRHVQPLGGGAIGAFVDGQHEVRYIAFTGSAIRRQRS